MKNRNEFISVEGELTLHIVKRIPIQFGGAQTIGQRVDAMIDESAQHGDILTRIELDMPKEWSDNR